MLGQKLFNVAAPVSMLLNRYLPVMSVVSETCVTVLAVVRLLFKTAQLSYLDRSMRA